MRTGLCPRHPAQRARRQCSRCGVGVCQDCRIRVGWRYFCDRGCNVIQAIQRAAAADWRVQQRIIRDAPVPRQSRHGLPRRRRALDAQRTGLRTRITPASPFRWGLPVRPGWVLLALVPLLVVVFQIGQRVPSVSLSSVPSRRPPMALPALPEVRLPPPPVPAHAPDLVPPSTPELPRLPLESNLSRGPTWERKVAMTFDGGAEANATTEILDILQAAGVRATIFLTGQYLRRYPDLVRRMIREGHEVGNHTFRHPHLTSFAVNRRHDTLRGVTREFVQGELRQTALLFEEVAGVPMSRYWRAPYGEHNPEIRRWAAEAGYLHVGWTRDLGAGEDLDTRDWVTDPQSPIYYDAAEVRERILGFGKGSQTEKNGGIVLLHLGTQRRRDPVHRELPTIIEGLRTQGYQLVPVSEMHRGLASAGERSGSAVAAE